MIQNAPINRLTELQSANLKVTQYQAKLKILKDRGKTRRDDEVKYYTELLKEWSAYALELEGFECRTCYTTEITMGKVVMGSGAFHVKVICPECGHNLKGNGQWVSKKHLPIEVIEALPVLADYTPELPPCEVCGERGVELHHWAPKELFPETFEEWPKSYLCKKHHNEWHKAITNPYRQLRKQQERNNVVDA